MSSVHKSIETMINAISKESIADFCREKSGDFFPSSHAKIRDATLFPREYAAWFDCVEIVGYFANLQMLVFHVSVNQNKILGERNCRARQFAFARNLLKQANDRLFGIFTDWIKTNPPADIWQALFVFSDKDGCFRFSFVESLARGQTESRKFRRHTFFVAKSQSNLTFKTRLNVKQKWSSIEDVKAAFSVEALNKEFYHRLSDWYFWAASIVKFEGTKVKDGVIDFESNAVFLIRMITRMIFVWFMKQKGLIPSELFDKRFIDSILKNNVDSSYYKAIIQNLFFATLNTEMDDASARKFRNSKIFQGQNEQHQIFSVYRYEDYFREEGKQKFLDCIRVVPFLNGGLFSCLDEKDSLPDCFTDNPQRRKLLEFPDKLFWAEETDGITFDLSAIYGDKSKKKQVVTGLIPLLSHYNFTVDESAPNDATVALDPELLGRVFENLLASYNQETASVARNSTGSFYTPREIVEYMVNDTLTQYIHSQMIRNGRDVPIAAIKKLVCEEDGDLPQEVQINRDHVVSVIEQCKTLDPACGSGAFPMGILSAIVRVLERLRPTKSSKTFYDRKLQIIKNCIYGVDIQPVAVQISKLRCFISLLAEDVLDEEADNRGIAPLPNLEMHFVAANTLIDLRGPEEGALPSSSQTEKIKNDMQTVADKLFSVRKHAKKKELEKSFSELRLQFKKSIANDLNRHDYDKLADWNPFDYMCASAFFSSAWMFGKDVITGFDVVIGNPPYGIINKKQGKKVAIVVSEDVLKYYKDSSEYEESRGEGSLNIYRLFIQRSMALLKTGGVFSEIFPLAYAGDKSAAKLRTWMVKNFQTIKFDAFPERDDPNKRVFEAAKMSVCILCVKKTKPKDGFVFRVHGDRKTFDADPEILISRHVAENIDPEYNRLPIASVEEYDLIAKIQKKSCCLKDLGCRCATGELDITADKKAFSNDVTLPQALRGAGVLRYAIPSQMSQGDRLYVVETELNQKDRKLKDIDRIVMQGMTGVNERIRIKAMLVDGVYCANSVNYIYSDSVDLYYLLGLLNCKLMNFMFSKFSTNSNVNGYEVNVLPFPAGKEITIEVSELARKIVTLRKTDEFADISKLDKQIDDLVYDFYELTDEERAIVDPERFGKKEGEKGVAQASAASAAAPQDDFDSDDDARD